VSGLGIAPRFPQREPVTSLLRVWLPILVCSCFLLLAPPRWTGAQDQPLITQIDVVGARRVEEATVRFKLKSRVGDLYSPETVREDIKALYGLGFFEDLIVRAEIFEGGLKLIFVIQEKPSIQSIRIVGNRKLATDKIKAKIDLVEGAIVAPGALVKNIEKIRLFYEEEGYYQAQVEGREERISPQEVAVTFTLSEGDKFDIGEIRIVGNRALQEKEIKGRLQTSELYLFFFGGTLKREELRRDLDRIRAYYLDNGFLDIAVEDPQIQLDTARKRIRIVIQVQEGPQYRIAELHIKGNSLFSEAEIRAVLKSRAGGIFSREALQADVVAIIDRYAERGYLFADVVPVTDILRPVTQVNVGLEITEGRQAFIHRIDITGNVRTRDKVIRRELQLIEGDVFNSTFLQWSRSRLQNLGFFEEVKLDTKRTAAPDRVDLTVDVKEKPTGAFSIGGGFSSEDGLLAAASISQANLFGLGKRASLTGQVGKNANRFNAIYSDPHFQDTDYLVEVQGYKTDTRYRENQGFNQDTLGTGLVVGHALVELIFGSLTYTFQRVKIYDLTDNAPFLVQRQAAESGGVSNTSSLTLTLTRDTRDSFTEPTRGLRAQATAEYAGGFLDADNNFVKAALDLSQYWPIWWKLVGHVRANIAYGDSFGDTPNLPVQERFFLGGINSIRGFRNFTLSPKDPVTDGLTGGNKSFFIQNEVLFPIYEPLRLRGVVFYDVGNNFDESTPFFTWDVRHGVGVGIRFISPLGAIRLEWGINLNRKEGEKFSVLYFSAGTAF